MTGLHHAQAGPLHQHRQHAVQVCLGQAAVLEATPSDRAPRGASWLGPLLSARRAAGGATGGWGLHARGAQAKSVVLHLSTPLVVESGPSGDARTVPPRDGLRSRPHDQGGDVVAAGDGRRVGVGMLCVSGEVERVALLKIEGIFANRHPTATNSWEPAA
jgi:hypothetical protein